MKKIIKCEFYQNKIYYLGHIISKEGILVDLEKIESVMNWPTPRNETKIRAFHGRNNIGGSRND